MNLNIITACVIFYRINQCRYFCVFSCT